MVTQPSKDMRDYKRLLKAVDAINDKVANAREKIDGTQKAGDTYLGSDLNPSAMTSLKPKPKN
jgi:hypothetical protein